MLDRQLLDGDGLGTARRLRMLDPAPQGRALQRGRRSRRSAVTARVAGADGLGRQGRPGGRALRGDPRWSRRGGDALPPLDRAQLDAAAHRVEPEDLALLAMLVDRTSHADVADDAAAARRASWRGGSSACSGKLRARTGPLAARLSV